MAMLSIVPLVNNQRKMKVHRTMIHLSGKLEKNLRRPSTF